MFLATYYAVFERLYLYLDRYRLRFVVSMFLTTLSALLALVPLLCVFFIARNLLTVGTMAANQVCFLAIVSTASVLLRFLGYLLAMGLSHHCAFGVHYDLRSRIAAHLATLPMGFFSVRSSGELKKVMGEDVENIELFIAHYLPDLVSAVVLPVFSAIVLFYVHPLLALTSIISVPLAVFTHYRMNKIYRKNVGAFHDNVEIMNTAIVEYVRGMPVIKAFNKTASSFGMYKKALKTHLSISEDWTKSATLLSSLFWMCLDLGLVFILPAGFFLFNAGSITGSEFVLFLLVGPGLMEPLGRIIMIAGYLDRIGEGMERIQSILDQKPLPIPNSPKIPQNHTIEFENVSFGYDTEEVLKGVSFVLPEKTVTGLVGPSGAGKSTIARLIARFWDIREGTIRLGGEDIRDIPMSDLMQQIAFVFQDVYLMNDTIMENIRMGKPDASDEEVKAAAASASAHDFIMELEENYHSRVGEGGAHLSGGEKQRISIARAILKDAPVLILDEITSSTDPENERHIHLGLNRLMTNKTVLVIAHKLPTIVHADQLLLFEGGSIKAMGTHDTLLQTDELYQTLWESCITKDDWKLSAREMSL